MHWLFSGWRAYALVALMAVGITCAGWLLFLNDSSPPPKQPPANTAPATEPITIDGTLTCLPAKGGVANQSCALGLQHNSDYYALDDESGSLNSIATNDRIQVTGTLIKKTNDSYDTKGLIVVTNLQKL